MDTETDVTDRTPRQRRTRGSSSTHARARKEFEQRAQDWLKQRPGKAMALPQDLAAVVALGVPCPQCGVLVRRDRQDGHLAGYSRPESGHWASGVTVEHGR
jgi:hypothetical protein